MPTIVTGEARVELFRDLVREGEARAHQPLDETLESYLVFTLIEHLRDTQLGSEAMALALLDGLDQVGAARAERLRTVGDRCLLIAGLFPDLAARRLVGPGYYAALGRHAYRELAVTVRAALAELYQMLAETFHLLVKVLGECRAMQDLRRDTWMSPVPGPVQAIGPIGPSVRRH